MNSELRETYPNLYVTATYSPEDNKIRLSCSQRLDKELYLRVKAAGFAWAPKQEIFVAPKWTPAREDLALELAGEIEDEDKSLVDRAEERAERFEGYGERRLADAERAKAAVDRIADGIPLGQPILVGHHSERHARKDAAKIENGMRKAVKMWDTAKYWEQRAAGALRAAKYKELPAVRARRIKTLEAELRSVIADFTPVEGVRPMMQSRWNDPADAPEILHVWVGPKGRGGRWVPQESLARIEAASQRWIQHYENRLVYERAMLAEGGGLTADKFEIEIGGRVRRRGEWLVVTKLNRKDGVLQSVSVIGHWASTLPVEEIQDYLPPAEGDAAKIKTALAKPPLVNFRKEGCKEMTLVDWKRYSKWNDSNFVETFKATETAGVYRLRTLSGKGYSAPRIPVFIIDSKEVPAPKPDGKSIASTDGRYAGRKAIAAEVRKTLAPIHADEPSIIAPVAKPSAPVAPSEFEAMRDSLRAGVQVVSAPQLFPTPIERAEMMVDTADPKPGERVLEPSAGTGRILDALHGRPGLDVVAIEINHTLADSLRARSNTRYDIRQGDFLEFTPEALGLFDVVLMNPPFANGADIKHIRHAMQFLRPGGRLVAICANGPRQNEQLKPIIESCGEWDDLPAGTFEGSHTGVNTAMLTYCVENEQVEQSNVVEIPSPHQTVKWQEQMSLFQ